MSLAIAEGRSGLRKKDKGGEKEVGKREERGVLTKPPATVRL